MNELKNCFNRGQLRKVEPSVEKSKLSIKQAREWLVEVEKNLEKYLFNSAWFMECKQIVYKL